MEKIANFGAFLWGSWSILLVLVTFEKLYKNGSYAQFSTFSQINPFNHDFF